MYLFLCEPAFMFMWSLLKWLGHHRWDLRTPMDNDPQWLIEQRTTEIKVIEEWLAVYPHP